MIKCDVYLKLYWVDHHFHFVNKVYVLLKPHVFSVTLKTQRICLPKLSFNMLDKMKQSGEKSEFLAIFVQWKLWKRCGNSTVQTVFCIKWMMETENGVPSTRACLAQEVYSTYDSPTAYRVLSDIYKKESG